MKITLVQVNLEWENPEANRKKIAEMLPAKGDTDLVVLPEMFTTGFTMRSSEMAEDNDGPTLRWMKKISLNGDFGLIGSYIVKEKAGYFNRLIFMKPDGSWSKYDKGHLFRMEKEDRHFTKGKERLVETFREVRINLQVCYDLRFPVWARNTNNEYDLLINVANWPEKRRRVWQILLVARAIENQAYVAGVNRIGTDGSGIFYAGDCLMIDPGGNIQDRVEPYSEGIITSEISLKKLNKFRQKFPVWKDADQFTIG